MKKWVLTIVMMTAFVAAFAVLSGCGNSAAADTEAPGETISVTGEQLYRNDETSTSASLPGNYTVKLRSTGSNWEITATSIQVGTVVDGKLSFNLQPLETSQLSTVFSQMPDGAIVNPETHNVFVAQQFEIFGAAGIASGTLSYENDGPRGTAVFLYSNGPLTVSATTELGSFNFQAVPGWNRLWWSDNTVTNNQPSTPLNAKWLFGEESTPY